MSEPSAELLQSLLEAFAPGISWVFRLMSAILGIDVFALSLYIFPFVALPAISTFILPWVWRLLGPIVFLFISSTTVRHRNNLYPQVLRWMPSRKFYSWVGSVIAGTTETFGFLWDSYHNTPELEDTDNPLYRGKLVKVLSSPGQRSLLFFRYEGCWLALYRDPHKNPTDSFSRNAEDIIFYYFSWNKAVVDRLLRAILEFNIDCRRGKLPVFCAHQDKHGASWRKMCDETPRSLESLALDETMKKKAMSDVGEFLSGSVQGSYEKRGIPHRRGYLLHGPPGTGKSSFCRAIASHFQLPIYVINLAIVDNYGLQELFRTLPPTPQQCLVLLEDVDVAGIQSRGDPATSDNGTTPQKTVTLASLLNALDGIGGHEGHILVVTTNVKPALDSALTRPGRIDRELEFQYPDSQTIQKYFCFFFDGYCAENGQEKKSLEELGVAFSKSISHLKLSPATIQGYFLKCHGDPAIAVQNWQDIEEKDVEDMSAWIDMRSVQGGGSYDRPLVSLPPLAFFSSLFSSP
ncbi:hypothetical protein N7532_001409 [Penicillium argentinense]|uniref:AAA+ ATPase domain-containing protein n=1 Tax=Penicillium argentinense TaxID=1131581 RepID=A0A9W9G2E6_9EURO|nr:uncharacterized protein N7532_001409 [Penicillium argentinense]KAJ5110874.1 hypothetical protein N7532_001409 [Penicillium argentinense]